MASSHSSHEGNIYQEDAENSLRKLLEKSKFWQENPLLLQKLESTDQQNPLLQKVQGCLVGLAVGDALGAPWEFRPHGAMQKKNISKMESGGTWGLRAGQWTDDTSMALCFAISLICCDGFNTYDQLKRYHDWYREGYLSSTGSCFDIGSGTKEAIRKFERRRDAEPSFDQMFDQRLNENEMNPEIKKIWNRWKGQQNCGANDGAGNGALMRLAPVPIFFHEDETLAVRYAGESSRLTHGDPRSIDACRLYSLMIVHALKNKTKEEILDWNSYRNSFEPPLHQDIASILKDLPSKRAGYASGIRGGGFVVKALEAALWGFMEDENDFNKGMIKVIQLGDDTDTTAAIYGQLAGAFYGLQGISPDWLNSLFAKNFILKIACALFMLGSRSDENNLGTTATTENTENAPILKTIV